MIESFDMWDIFWTGDAYDVQWKTINSTLYGEVLFEHECKINTAHKSKISTCNRITDGKLQNTCRRFA